ncbi:hypothetical protein ABPG72_021865 [Tetrahymena utriculariae]
MTLALFSLLAVLLSYQIKQVIEQTYPKVIFEEQIVSNPSKYNLSKKNFSFVMALYYSFQGFINYRSIFSFQAIFYYKVPFNNLDGSKGQPVLQKKAMEIEVCNENSFQVQGTESYFKNLQYNQIYCFKKFKDFYFVGQFENYEFSFISIQVVVCEDNDPQNTVKCMETTQKDKILSNSSLHIYYSNFVAHLQDKSQPFQSVGQTVFWNAKDDSLILSNKNSQNQLLFSSYRSTLLTQTSNSIFIVSLFLEKNREQTYYREYPKFSDMFSKVGGLFNVLFVFGCIIAKPYSQLQLNRKLFNSTFEISKGQTTQDEINNQQNEIILSEKSQKREKDDKEWNKGTKLVNKTINEKKNSINQQKINVFRLANYQRRVVKRFKSEAYQMVDFGTQQILNYTDICFVVNKLIELEKLKTVILNDQQIKLFEFIPRSQIDIQLIKQLDEQTNTSNKHQKTCMMTDMTFSKNQIANNQIMTQNEDFSLKQKQFNILSIKNRSIYETAKQAQEAFNNIYNNQQKQSQIDLKLIQMIDNLLQLLKNNKFNENNCLFFQLQRSKQNSIAQPQLLSKMEKFSSVTSQSNLNRSGYASQQNQQQAQLKGKQQISYETELNELKGSEIQLSQNRPKNFIDEIHSPPM